MSKLTKNRKLALEKLDKDKQYTIVEASGLVKEMTTTKFDAAIDIDVRLGVDPRKANQMVRGVVLMPNGLGKTVRVLVFAEGDDARIAELVAPVLRSRECDPDHGPELENVVALIKERASSIVELADAAVLFYRALHPTDELKAKHYSAESRPALLALRKRLAEVDWQREAIGNAVKEAATEYQLKMPKVAMPLRVMVTGEPQTPPIGATLELIGRDEVLARMDRELPGFPG